VAAVYTGEEVGCTGVLIAPGAVLTAGHCATATEVLLDAADYATSGGELYTVAEVVVHPDGDEVVDLAVLLLDGATDIPPAPLALGCALDEALVDGAGVRLVGYGATDRFGTIPTSLLHEALGEVQDHDCDALERGCREAISPGGELIAGGDGVDTCIGDSGGPVYLETPWGLFLVGITSRGVTDATAYCEGGGIYVRPDAFVGWLEEVTGEVFEVPECPLDTGGDDTGGDDTGGDDGKGGCGCVAGGTSPMAVWLLGGLVLGMRRRR